MRDASVRRDPRQRKPARQQVIPDDAGDGDLQLRETASEKVSELLLHLFIAIVVVTLFVMLAMGLEGRTGGFPFQYLSPLR